MLAVAVGSLCFTVGVSVDLEVCFQGMKGKIDEYSDSDDDQHDAYLERMKAEGKIREEGNDSDESDSGSGASAWCQTRDRFCKSAGLNGLPVVFIF